MILKWSRSMNSTADVRPDCSSVSSAPGDALGEAGPVEQSGHRVVRGLVLQAVAERTALADVLDLADREHRVAVVVEHGRHRDRHPHGLAVAAPQSHLDLEAVAVSGRDLGR